MFNPETGRIIRLTHGAGNGVDKACLMTASSMLIGKGEDGDNNSCVCSVLREFIITTNDAMPEDLLGELYGPLAWEILGTATGDHEIERQRAYRFADWAVREITPIALREVGLGDSAAKLESLPPVVDQQTSYAAVDAARAAARAVNAADSAVAAVDAARAAARAVDAATYAARAVIYASHAAVDAACAAELIWRKCPDIIREVAAIGDRRPVETVIDHCALAEALAN